MVPKRIGHRRIAKKPFRRRRQTDEFQHQRQYDNARDCKNDENDSRYREEESGGVEAHQAALFPLIVDHIERIEESCHAGIRAYKRDKQSDDERRSQGLITLSGNEQTSAIS